MQSNQSANPRTRPGAPLVGAIAIGVGLTIVIAAILTAIVGERAPEVSRPDSATTSGGPSGQASDPTKWQVVVSTPGSFGFEAPLGWTTEVKATAEVGGDKVAVAGAVSATYDDFKAAKTEGVVVAVTDPTDSTSAGFAGALIGNSDVFCPTAGGCTTGKPQEVEKVLDSPVRAVDTQYTIAPPADDDTPGEFRYTIETASPTRYIVVIVRATDPEDGADVMEHAVATLDVG